MQVRFLPLSQPNRANWLETLGLNGITKCEHQQAGNERNCRDCFKLVEDWFAHREKTLPEIWQGLFKGQPEKLAALKSKDMKDQIKSPRLEERRKEISQEVKDVVNNYTPQPDNFDQLYDILVDYESGEITINEAIDLINKARI